MGWHDNQIDLHIYSPQIPYMCENVCFFRSVIYGWDYNSETVSKWLSSELCSQILLWYPFLTKYPEKKLQRWPLKGTLIYQFYLQLAFLHNILQYQTMLLRDTICGILFGSIKSMKLIPFCLHSGIPIPLIFVAENNINHCINPFGWDKLCICAQGTSNMNPVYYYLITLLLSSVHCVYFI